MSLPYTEEQIRCALAQKSPPGIRSVQIEGKQVSRIALSRMLKKLVPIYVPESVHNREAAAKSPVPDSKKYFNSWKPDGSHVKNYVVTWIDSKDFSIRAQKYPGTGMSQALMMHHVESRGEAGIISCVCII